MNWANVQRVMLIVWRWGALSNGSSSEDNYPVKGTKKDLIIRMNQLNSVDTLEHIANWIQKLNKATKVYVFLHRGHGFDDEHVGQLLDLIKAMGKPDDSFRCFLFSDGRDFIYYNTQSIGLLGQTGEFMNDPEYIVEEYNEEGETVEKITEVCVYEYNEVLQQNEIIPRYFNIVWSYYEFEFQKKIKELRLDILSYLTAIPDKGQNKIQKGADFWCTEMELNKEKLSLRVRSFLNMYTHGELQQLSDRKKKIRKSELKLLKKFEKKRQTSLVFDDCNANLVLDGARKAYQDVSNRLRPIFIREKLETPQTISLEEIDQQFIYLIKELENLS